MRGLVDGELGRFRRSSRSSFLVEMVQDLSNDGRLGDEGDDLHFFAATPAGQRVELEDAVDELGPSLSTGARMR